MGRVAPAPVIVHEGSAPATVRRGEFQPFPGARARLRGLAYPGFDPAGADPWRGSYRRAEEASVSAGPGAPEPWIEAFDRAPAGKILIGPVPPAESVYGAAAAAVAAIRQLGRSAVLVETAERPEDDVPAGPDLARVVVWDGAGTDDGFWRGFRRGAAPAGVALPWIPGWTGEERFLEDFFGAARLAGAVFAAGFSLAGDGASRAAIHADYARRDPGGADAFFDAIHHRDWGIGTREARARFLEAAARAGLPPRVPPLVGAREFEANARLAEALDTEADEADEPRASALRAAARRVEDFGRDVGDLD
ncbi:MAG TPA: hypothetical protein VFL12_11295, partial [Thermoanaerobaculia bacterium]|nr:hypothetical protein [Thermoanaerobaculia bacterium]